MAGQTPPNPAELQWRFGHEDTGCGLGDVSTFVDARMRSESLGAELPTIEDDSIVPFGEEAEGLESKIDPGGDIQVNWMLEDHARLLANFFTKSATPVESPTGVWLHKLAVTESAVSFPRSQAHEISRDRGRPTFYTGALTSQLTFNASPRGLLQGAVSLVVPRFHYFDDPVQIVGAGSTLPFLRGIYGFADLEAATADLGDLFLLVTAVPGGGDADIDAKISLAATYLGTDITIVAGLDAEGNPIFTRLTHTAADVDVGQNEDLPVEVHWPDTPTLVATDEFRIARRRDVWTPSLPVKRLCNEISVDISVEGVTKRVRDFALTLTRPAELDEAIGGRFVDVVLERGERTAFGELNRAALGLDFENRLLAAESFDLDVVCRSTLIAATGVRSQLAFRARNCKPTGRTASVAGRTQFDESFGFRCHPSTDGTYPAAITVELTNSQSALV